MFNEIALLDLARHARLELDQVNRAQTTFFETYTARLKADEEAYDCRQHDRLGYVIASRASISGNYYLNEGTRVPGSDLGNRTMFIALGDWKKYMAPPSIVEFTLTLLVAAVGFYSKAKRRDLC